MTALQRSMSSWLVGTLAASCLLLMALWMQESEAFPLDPHCRLDKTDFWKPYINNLTFMLVDEASLADNNTDIRLFSKDLFHGVNVSERCYLMKQVLNFTIEEVLLSQFDRFQPYMKEVVPFFQGLKNKLRHCHIQGHHEHIQSNLDELKDTVRKLGDNGEIKVISELNSLFMYLKEACVHSQEIQKVDN